GRRMIMVALFIGLLVATWGIFRIVPPSFVPQEDEGYFMVIVQGPAGASLEYTSNVLTQAEAVISADPEVLTAFSVGGFSFAGAASHQGMMFVRLRPLEERMGEGQSLQDVLTRLQGQLLALPGALVIPIAPPAIQGLSPLGGFQLQILDQTGGDVSQLAAVTQQVIGAATAAGRLTSLNSSFTANDPQLVVDIDRDRLRTLGLPMSEVTSALAIMLGSQYVNDFDFNNRAYRVYVQGDQAFRARPEDLGQYYARTADGRMVPLDTVVRLRESTAPSVLNHSHLFRSTQISGNAAPGVSPGDALRTMEEVAAQVLPAGFSFAWSGQALEELKSGAQAFYLFALSLLVVYLVLAAQYESWVLPFIILLGVPLAVLGALSAQFVRGLANDVFCQIGLVMLIGLAAKNSILIVEFAEQLREQGKTIVDAAIEASRIRLRPIVMTSLAFILGVMPLALATGAGAAARNSVGTTVAGGMLASMFLSLTFIPVLYVVIRTAVPGKGRRDHKDVLAAELGGAQ